MLFCAVDDFNEEDLWQYDTYVIISIIMYDSKAEYWHNIYCNSQ